MSRRGLRRNERRRGAALILTLLVLAILVVLVVQFTFSVRVEETVVRNTEDDAALELAARPGAPALLAALFRDDRKNGEPKGNVDTLADIWCDPNTAEQRKVQIGQVELELTVEDLERRLPLCWLGEGSEEQQKLASTALTRLITKLAPAPVEPEAAAKLITERVQQLMQGAAAGQAAAPGGAPPGGAPGAAAPGGAPPRRALVGLEQLLDDENTLDRRILYGDPQAEPPTEGIAGYVTTWPVPKINLNSALGPVLFAILPEKDAATENQQSLWDSADEIVEAIRRYRIDPDFVSQGGAAGEGGQAPTGERGASRKWPGTPFAEVGELQKAEIHAKLAKVFEAGAAGGQQPGGQQPPPGGQPGGGLPGGGQPGGGQPASGGNALFKSLLTVESRYYAVKVVARLQGQDLQAPTEGQDQGVQSVFRLVLYRASSDQVTPLFVGESAE